MQDSPIGWVGGKKRLRKSILERFPIHTTFVEVFAGAAWILFAKDQSTSRAEIVNDLNGELTNFYRCVRERPLELVEQIKWRLISQEDLKLEQDLIGGSEIERAARFYWKLKIAFGSRATRSSFGYQVADVPRFRPERVWDIIQRAHDRLQHVCVFGEDFERLITRLDRPETFFYCDPPYHGCEDCYKPTFSIDDHQRLANVLKNLRGSFLLSYNDHDAIRSLFSWATVEQVQTKYSVMKDADGRQNSVTELLIRNYDIATENRGQCSGRKCG